MTNRRTAGHWDRVEELFHAALELPASDRAAFLDETCADDADLRRTIERLLIADGDEVGRLEELTIAGDTVSISDDTVIGSWRVVSEIGRGGMGIVYLAERADGTYHQKAALKVVRGGVLAATFETRFLRERRILATLQHPNIARLLDAGATADGLPYLVMELVEGEPITDWCESRALTLESKLRLMVQVCDALAHAHQNLIVHRDLKPGNVLVTADGVAHLVDFGVAHLLDTGTEDPLTRETLLPMTPEYAAPEQFSNDSVTTGTDVFAAGAILYELICGRQARPINHGSVESMLAALRQPIVPPSKVSPGVSGHRRLSSDLDAIVMKALADEPSRRYATISEFAADIRRFLSNEPIAARPDSLAYRLNKFVRRHKLGVLAASALFIAIAAGIGATMWQASEARTQALKAEAVTDFMLSLFGGVDPAEALGDELTARQLVDAGAMRVQTEFSDQPLVRAEVLTFLADMYDKLDADDRGLELVNEALDVVGQESKIETANALLVKGRILIGRGENEVGVAVLENAIPVLEQYGQDSDIAEAHDLIAIALKNEGQLQEALVHTEAGLALRIASVGAMHVTVAESYNNLGVLARSLGDLEAARDYHSKALDIRYHSLAPDHPKIAISLNNLGAVLYAEGDIARAAERFSESLEINRRVNGDQHHDTIAALNNLGFMQMRLGHVQEAEQSLSEVLDYWVAQNKANHPNALITRVNLATVWRTAGDIEKALAEYRRVEPLVVQALGPDHPIVAAILHHQARALIELAEVSEAAPLLDRALAIRIQATGEKHSGNAELYRDQAWLAWMHQDPETALELANRALELQESSLPPRHPSIAATRIVLGNIERSLGRHNSAEQLHQQAHELLEQQFGAEHPDTVVAAFELGRTLVASGKAAEVEQLLSVARPILASRLGESSWQVAELDLALANAREALGRAVTGQRADAISRLIAALPMEHPRRVSLLEEVSRAR